jgi:glycosyltransferase involved in cell wall biosynthesis
MPDSVRFSDAAPSIGHPFVSVIVPTYNRAQVLPYLFEALAQQRYPAESIELIVVDNSSSDDSETVFERWRTVFPFRAAFYRKENKGPACSRNYGAARARGEVLAFTDSDCTPSAEWLASATEAFATGAGIICGPITPTGWAGSPGLTAAQLDPVVSDRGLYPTANLFVRREAFEAVGGFDERFGLYPWGELVAGEDCDLGWRLRRAGERPAFVTKAAVGHLATRMRLSHLLLRPVRVQIFPRLLRSVPELRHTYLWAGYFVSPARPYYYLAGAALGAALATQSWTLLLGLVPWIAFHARGTVSSLVASGRVLKALAWLGILAWLETLTTAFLFVGSFRHRRLVL